ncbi:MAG TPA: Rnf-Nqr domain containing protein [Planctomycetota bacterium]|nr:Rnf-Nqr domain containing protein [Planctomycetota bacterium]HRR78559.1 Rnf-Nqr domain containing protein [Planctomycetota bacterium]HRT94812.1 Rnf-Nqr domain containing protein [Planctomycetota bacterium]
MSLERIFLIVIGNLFVTNFVLARFLGLCPFVGVSKRTSDALGMGLAVTFVMAMASVLTHTIDSYVLRPQAPLLVALAGAESQIAREGLQAVLRTLVYILTIAAFVQLVEMFLKKNIPALYRALGIYLPLITTNCAVLGVALLNTPEDPAEMLTLPEAVIQGTAAGLGFTLVMLLMAGIRERIEALDLPEPMRGMPIAFVCTGLMALAFLGFTGMV